MVCVPLTKDDIIHLPSILLSRLLVRRVRIHEQPFPCLSEIAILCSSHLLGELRSAEDSPDLARRSRLALVVTRLGTFVANVISEVPLSNEFLDLIPEHNAHLDGVADIFVISEILILIPFLAVSSQRIRLLVYACMLSGQEDVLIRPN